MSSDLDASIGQHIRAAREATNLSQEALASLMVPLGHPFHQTTVNKIENGQRKVTAGEAWDFATVLGVPIQDLLEGTEGSLGWLFRQMRQAMQKLQKQWGLAIETEKLARQREAELSDLLDEFRTLARSSPEQVASLGGQEYVDAIIDQVSKVTQLGGRKLFEDENWRESGPL